MGNGILEPSVVFTPKEEESNQQPLLHDNYLSEFKSEDEKSIARANLGVYGTDVTFTRDEAMLAMNEAIKKALQNYVSTTDLPKAIEALSQTIANEGYVKADGSVPFTAPQSQTALPVQDSHLANKLYVDTRFTAHLREKDPHKILEQVETILADYIKASETYTKSSLYTKKEINTQIAELVRKDGTVPFTKPQIGVDPQFPSHLATMRYVNLVMQNHNTEQDPHGFMETLRKSLSNYYTKSETYTKAQTFSRTQLLDIIQKQMGDVVEQALAKYVAENGSVEEFRTEFEKILKTLIKSDGSVAHSRPQAGQPAENENEFVVLSQLIEKIDELSKNFTETINKKTNQTTWVTSGPVRRTVGFVKEHSRMPKEMTMQQIWDAVFYGRQTGVKAPHFAEYGEQVCLRIYLHGIGLVESVDIYKNGELIGTLYPEDFTLHEGDEGAYYEFCNTGEFTEDTEWEARFHYPEDQEIVDSTVTRLSYPIFIGTVPYWWNAGEDITMDSLRELVNSDPENCKFFTHLGPKIHKLKTSFSFVDSNQRSIVVVIPDSYPALRRIITPTQMVEVSAFARWLQPMYPNNVEVGVPYKIYVFNQPLVQLDQVVKFEFGESREEDDDE